ncbi:carboxymuconolactone decarboxylase family protein [Sphingobacterium sp. ML3W]|uniref:carboxymuconolactone decarboxylase family protein n=1 Tax=Sphingobacterium sp. ML3W TaxID=1538644 RepID=UPI002499FB74|nr:carboxymuconolactone decarboxylase family protein [Sphingobacterium sp. ML3W]WFA81001.1 carboxymuconolactone decarboxylase family protein [Sphingobacterium sp. ML3W]
MKRQKFIILLILTLFCQASMLYAGQPAKSDSLSNKEKGLVNIAATTASGELTKLKDALNKGLDHGLTTNQIKEGIIHLYAYAGFPRSIRGLQTLMEVLEERRSKGINDRTGAEASPIRNDKTKYDRGKAILEKLTGVPEREPKTGYAAFAPTIEVFLKEHLFADIFERDVLSYAERELVTVSVLASIGGVEPMLKSHLTICLNVGLSEEKLQQFVSIIEVSVGKKEAMDVQKILAKVLAAKK